MIRIAICLLTIALSGWWVAAESPPAPSGPENGSLTFEIDAARSHVGFEMGATLHTVVGKASAVTGRITVPASPDPSGFPVGGRIRIAARTLDTGNARRDRRMRSESLAVEKYPEIVFTPSKALGGTRPAAPGGPMELKLLGDLTIRDTTRPIEILVRARVGEQEIVADGEARLTFLDYGVPDPSNFLLHVDSEVKIHLHVEAHASRPPP